MRCGLCHNSVQGFDFDKLSEGDRARIVLVSRSKKQLDVLEAQSLNCLAGSDREHCHIDNGHGGEEWIFEVKKIELQ